MSLDIEGLFALWNDAPEDVDAATRRLTAFHHDPVVVNGVAVLLRDLVMRARGVAGMLDRREEAVAWSQTSSSPPPQVRE